MVSKLSLSNKQKQKDTYILTFRLNVSKTVKCSSQVVLAKHLCTGRGGWVEITTAEETVLTLVSASCCQVHASMITLAQKAVVSI